MTQSDVRNSDELNWEAAFGDLTFVEEGEHGIVAGPMDVLVERLLQQIEACGREPFYGEALNLSRAISAYANGSLNHAGAFAHRAASAGSKAFERASIDAADIKETLVELKEALAAARSGFAPERSASE